MKIIIHDGDQEFERSLKHKEPRHSDTIFIHDDGSIMKCTGCFGCWIKTPGKCVLPDSYQDMGAKLGHAQELVIISQCIYGTYSPFVRNLLDRSLSYMHPDFVIREGAMHHQSRYQNQIRASGYFYGATNPQEEAIARELFAANMLNFNGIGESVEFYGTKEELLNGYRIH